MVCGVAEFGLQNYSYSCRGCFFEPDNEAGCHGKPNFVGGFRRADFDVVVEHDASGFRRNELPTDAAARRMSTCWATRSSGATASDSTSCSPTRWSGGSAAGGCITWAYRAGTVQEYLIFQKHVVDRLRPGDTVVLVFFGNDFGDNVGLNSRGRAYATIDNGQVRLVPPVPVSTVRQWKNWMKDTSYLFNLATYCIDNFQEKRSLKNLGDRATRIMPSPQQVQAETCDRGPAVQITRHYLSELKSACRAKQVRFLAAFVPGQAELGEDDVTSTSDLSLPEELPPGRPSSAWSAIWPSTRSISMPPMVAAKRSGRFETRLTLAPP